MKQHKAEFGRLVQLKIKRRFSNLKMKSSHIPEQNQRTSPFHTKTKLIFAYFKKKPIKSADN